MRGFSLLEMLVVLVLMGLAAGLVAPSLSRTAERVRAAGDRDDIRRQLQALPAVVRSQGRPLLLAPGENVVSELLHWPDGWEVVATTSLRVEPSGWCHGGDLQARGSGEVLLFRVAAPDCHAELLDAP